jgi:16S rRNA (guanine527-N7)-methyltransferase
VEVLLKGVQRLGLDLGEEQIALFQRYFQELVEWNRRTNLTAITDYREVQAKHFLDSLTVSLAIPRDVATNGTLMDVGSGAGFPGLPLKLLWPGLRVTLVESVGKKAAFLRHLTDTLGLEGVEVCNERSETLSHDPRMRETFDVVVSRAVADLSVLAELTLPFCKPGGRVVAQKKSGIEDELKRAERAISLLGGALETVEVVDLEEIGEPRWLVVLTKDAESPSRYPRRPGIPVKRPL